MMKRRCFYLLVFAAVTSIIFLLTPNDFVKDKATIQYVQLGYAGKTVHMDEAEMVSFVEIVSHIQHRRIPTYLNRMKVGAIEIDFFADGKPKHLTISDEDSYCYSSSNQVYAIVNEHEIYGRLCELLSSIS